MHLANGVLVSVIIHCLIQNAQATNLWFMPGDACFPVVFDLKLATQLQRSTQTMHFDFSSLSNGGMFCGYAGYNAIELRDVPNSWSENIQEIYKELRSINPRVVLQEFDGDGKLINETEDNAFLMFIQNRSFDVEKFQTGFRYNEDWMNEFPDEPCRSSLYQPYFRDSQDIKEDWANGKHVSPLTVQFPMPNKNASTEFERRFGNEPINGSAKDLKLVIMANETLDAHLRRQSDHESVTYFRSRTSPRIVLEIDGIWLYRRDREGKFQKTPWKKGLKLYAVAGEIRDDEE